MAIWDDPKMCPRSYNINGYLMLNGKKMSKKDGNFMTMQNAIDQFGADPVRLTLAEGEGLDDGDFRTNLATGNMLKLYSETEWFKETIDMIVKDYFHDENTSSNDNFWYKVFDNAITSSYNQAIQDYEASHFRKAITNGFYKMLSARDRYRNMYEKKHIIGSKKLMLKFIECCLLIIEPICPHWATHIRQYAAENKINFSNVFIKVTDNYTIKEKHDLEYYSDILTDTLNKVYSQIEKLKAKKKTEFTVTISVVNGFTKEEKDIIEQFKLYDKTKDWGKFVKDGISDLTDKKLVPNFAKFINYVKSRTEEYSTWLELINNSKEELECYNYWIQKLVKSNKLIINMIDAGQHTAFKYGPGNPIIKVD
jgi:leucyl-tRNA synthetase